jgi:phosphate transport system permease protein
MDDLRARGRAVLGDRVFRMATMTAALLVLAILALILITTLREAWPALRQEGMGFFTGEVWSANDPDGEGPGRPSFGTLALVYGTLVVSLIAVLVAVPVSIAIALFLTELAPRRLRSAMVTIVDLLAAVPSVVFGLWGILVIGPALVPAYRWVHDVLGSTPLIGSLFGEASQGRTFMTAGLIVAIMIVPVITSITREVFATVPETDRQAAFALGATRWEMIRGVVLPHSFGGLVGAVMLGLGRAMGETIAVALVIGAAVQITPNLFATGEALPSIIVRQWGESGGVHTAALIGCGVVLFTITVIINYVARFIVRRAETRLRGVAA